MSEAIRFIFGKNIEQRKRTFTFHFIVFFSGLISLITRRTMKNYRFVSTIFFMWPIRFTMVKLVNGWRRNSTPQHRWKRSLERFQINQSQIIFFFESREKKRCFSVFFRAEQLASVAPTLEQLTKPKQPSFKRKLRSKFSDKRSRSVTSLNHLKEDSPLSKSNWTEHSNRLRWEHFYSESSMLET